MRLRGNPRILEVYIVLFVLIIIGNILPIEQVQTPLQKSSISKIIVDDTPILSEKVKELWQTVEYNFFFEREVFSMKERRVMMKVNKNKLSNY